MKPIAAILLLLICAALPRVAVCSETPDDALHFFESAKIRPLLAEQCYGCHSVNAKKLKGGLRVDSRNALLKAARAGWCSCPAIRQRANSSKPLRTRTKICRCRRTANSMTRKLPI